MVIDYGKIIFGGVDSSEYGIYISGEGVYNAPERVVEFVEVPGRNGAIAMDQGRYENISVTYPAMYLGKDQEEFREKLSDFRNAILSQKGYQRLEDSYHPDEYRMGVYASGLEVTKVFRKMRGGEFELTFNCKPQRWLTVGALPIPVDSGDVLQNPTVFDSSPLLEMEGYGTVSFNGYQFTLNNVTIGNIQLDRPYNSEFRRSTNYQNNILHTVKLDTTYYNIGDTIHVGPSRYYLKAIAAIFYSHVRTDSTAGNVTPTSVTAAVVNRNPIISINLPEITFTAGTSSDQYYSTKITAVIPSQGGMSLYVTARIRYRSTTTGDFIDTEIAMSAWSSESQQPADSSLYKSMEYYVTRGGITVDSSIPALGNPTYVDCETGDVYKVEGDSIVAVRNAATLGSDLPVLGPGSNKITFDNTVTDLKIAPRWWKV